MSYHRFGQWGSDIYLFMHCDGYLVCMWCALMPDYPAETNFKAYNTQAMIDHLHEHKAAGHCIPDFDGTITELWEDDAENFSENAETGPTP